jgi:hypothetical protein
MRLTLPRTTSACCLFAAWLMSVLTACEEPRECYPGDYRACACGEERGYQRCDEDAYAACVCDGTTPGLVDASGGGGGGLLPFMSPCNQDAECETGLCFLFPAKGPYCSKPCSVPADCPPPSTGCNNMGVCKAP